MQVKLLTSEDAATWKALRLDAIKTFPGAFLTTHDEAEAVPLDRTAAWLDGGQTHGVFEAGELVGAGTLGRYQRTQMRHRANLGPFFVRPEVQGRGAANALMEAMIDGARDAGIWQMELHVAETNGRAIAFYRRHGFIEAGRIPNATVLDSHHETDLLLIRTDGTAHQ
ncbi:GNAT family N-acetyltransferase [uncultured Tateyamaria sp.]|uniref:GNAT family N-acetyltransferase n=1 Tax=uncultured Tateyamaria sp. TaxID=455651 RepID=UPI00263880E5|nr:GNAT family N-acetyltransferase [uncultured Tateyamaria sp.]